MSHRESHNRPFKRRRPNNSGRSGHVGGERERRGSNFHRDLDSSTPRSYFKSSMVEDPWKPLVVNLCDRNILDPALLNVSVVVKG